MKKLNARFAWTVKNVQGRKILDVGFAKHTTGGEWLHEVLLRTHPEASIIGLDISERLFNPEMRMDNTVMGDALKMPFRDESFDAVCMFELIEHLWEPRKLMVEAHRVLRKGGRIYLSTPNPYDVIRVLRTIITGRGTLGEETHTMFMCPISFRNLFEKAGFAVERVETVILRIPKIRIEIQCVLPWPLQYAGYNQCYVVRKL